MTDGVASCAAAMEASQRQLEIATENLSNLETDGFRHHVDMASGARSRALPLRPTGRKLDLAMTGPSMMKFAPIAGRGYDLHKPVEARAASLHRDDAGHLLDTHGRALIGADGRLVTVPDGAEAQSDGSFTLDHATVGRVAVGTGSELRAGFVEGSDVNSIAEMMEVIDAQRQFETASKALTSVDTARQKAANEVGKIQG